MRKLIRIIVLLAVFLAGYYLGHLPGSPDIFAHAAKVCRGIDATTRDIAATAEAENTTLTETALSRLFGRSEQRAGPEDLPAGGRSGD